MKFRIFMKTPDAVHEAAYNAAVAEVKGDEEDGERTFGNDEYEIDDDGDEREEIKDRTRELVELASKWFRFGENVIIEIDTEAKTATVLEGGSL